MVMVSVARRRYALAVAFACFITLGATSGMLGVAWPSIRAAFGLPLDALVALMIATTISFAIGSVTAGPLIARLGIGWVLLIANVVGFVGCLGYFLAPSWWTLVAFGLLAGWTPGTIITGMNIYVAAIHSVRTMNWMHASFGLGATLGPLLMTAIVGAGLSWGWGYAVAAAVFLALALACLTVVRTMTFRGVEHADDSATTRPSLGATLRLPIVWLSVLMFLLYTGVETTAGQWTYAWFTGTRAASPYVAGVITSIFWAMLTIGRVVFGAGAARIGVERLLRLCMLGAVLAAVLLLPRSLPVGLVAIALLGLSLSTIFPTLTSHTPARLGARHAGNAISLQTGAASVGTAALPGLAGFVAARAGLEALAPFLVAAAVSLLLVHQAAAALSRRQQAARALDVTAPGR